MISTLTAPNTSTPAGINRYANLTLKELTTITGSLSQPSKMPCHGYSLPASMCTTGGKLHKVENSVCKSCYALKGRYMFNNVQSALRYRYDALVRNPEIWRDALIELIRRKEKSGYFRWHDSGDLQGVYHLRKINEIALALPDITFWLPTRETRILSDFLQDAVLADNLIVRVSSFFINQRPNSAFTHTSTVGWSESKHHCPAPKQDNQCKDCRACWSSSSHNINYHLH